MDLSSVAAIVRHLLYNLNAPLALYGMDCCNTALNTVSRLSPCLVQMYLLLILYLNGPLHRSLRRAMTTSAH